MNWGTFAISLAVLLALQVISIILFPEAAGWGIVTLFALLLGGIVASLLLVLLVTICFGYMALAWLYRKHHLFRSGVRK